MDYTQQARERFANDLFATKQAGIFIEKAEQGYAECSMKIEEHHQNAVGFVMGGAIYTLCDFAFAVAANCGAPITVTLSSNINFISATKAKTLFAKAKTIKSGRNLCFYQVDIVDENGKLCASATQNGFITSK